jgi:hypothetical protein
MNPFSPIKLVMIETICLFVILYILVNSPDYIKFRLNAFMR